MVQVADLLQGYGTGKQDFFIKLDGLSWRSRLTQTCEGCGCGILCGRAFEGEFDCIEQNRPVFFFCYFVFHLLLWLTGPFYCNSCIPDLTPFNQRGMNVGCLWELSMIQAKMYILVAATATKTKWGISLPPSIGSLVLWPVVLQTFSFTQNAF